MHAASTIPKFTAVIKLSSSIQAPPQIVNLPTSHGGKMTDCPPMNGCRTLGTRTVPSSCWKFSRMATIMRGTAHAVALRVCTNSVATFFCFLGFSEPLDASSSLGAGLHSAIHSTYLRCWGFGGMQWHSHGHRPKHKMPVLDTGGEFVCMSCDVASAGQIFPFPNHSLPDNL